jgi:hypothetical protein
MANKPTNTFHFYENSEIKEGLSIAMRFGNLDDALFFAVERDESGNGNAAWMVIFRSFFEDIGFANVNLLPQLLSIYNSWAVINHLKYEGPIGKSHTIPQARICLLYAVALVCNSPKSRAIADISVVAAAHTDLEVIVGCSSDPVEWAEKMEWENLTAEKEGSDPIGKSSGAINVSIPVNALGSLIDHDPPSEEGEDGISVMELCAVTSAHMLYEVQRTEFRFVPFTPLKWIHDMSDYALAERKFPDSDQHHFLRILGRAKVFMTRPTIRAYHTLLSSAKVSKNRSLVFHLLCIMEIMCRDMSCERNAMAYAVLLTMRAKSGRVGSLKIEFDSNVEACRALDSSTTAAAPSTTSKSDSESTTEKEIPTVFDVPEDGGNIGSMDAKSTQAIEKALALYDLLPPPSTFPPRSGNKRALAPLEDLATLRKRRSLVINPFYLSSETYRGSGTDTRPLLEKQTKLVAEWKEKDSIVSHGPPVSAAECFSSKLVPPKNPDFAFVDSVDRFTTSINLPGSDELIPETLDATAPTHSDYLRTVIYGMERIPRHVTPCKWDVLFSRRANSILLAEEEATKTKKLHSALIGAPRTRSFILDSISRKAHAQWCKEIPDEQAMERPACTRKRDGTLEISKPSSSSSSSSSKKKSPSSKKKRNQEEEEEEEGSDTDAALSSTSDAGGKSKKRNKSQKKKGKRAASDDSEPDKTTDEEDDEEEEEEEEKNKAKKHRHNHDHKHRHQKKRPRTSDDEESERDAPVSPPPKSSRKKHQSKKESLGKKQRLSSKGGSGSDQESEEEEQKESRTEPNLSQIIFHLGGDKHIALAGSERDVRQLAKAKVFRVSGIQVTSIVKKEVLSQSESSDSQPEKDARKRKEKKHHAKTTKTASSRKKTTASKKRKFEKGNRRDEDEDGGDSTANPESGSESTAPAKKKSKRGSLSSKEGPYQKRQRTETMGQRNFDDVVGEWFTDQQEQANILDYPLAQKPTSTTKKFVVVAPDYVYRGPFDAKNEKDLDTIQRTIQRTFRMRKSWKDVLVTPQILVGVKDSEKNTLRYYVRSKNFGNGDSESWQIEKHQLKTHGNVSVNILTRSPTSSGTTKASSDVGTAMKLFGPAIVKHLCAAYLMGCGDPGLGNVILTYKPKSIDTEDEETLGKSTKISKLPTDVFAVDVEGTREQIPIGKGRTLVELLFVPGKQPPKAVLDEFLKIFVENEKEARELIDLALKENVENTNHFFKKKSLGSIPEFDDKPAIKERAESLLDAIDRQVLLSTNNE